MEYVFVGEEIDDGIFAWISVGINASESKYVSPAVLWTAGGGVPASGGGGGPPGGPGNNGTFPPGGPPVSLYLTQCGLSGRISIIKRYTTKWRRFMRSKTGSPEDDEVAAAALARQLQKKRATQACASTSARAISTQRTFSGNRPKFASIRRRSLYIPDARGPTSDQLQVQFPRQVRQISQAILRVYGNNVD
ncbi:unnamed protein product [Aphanomyces euteiches]